MARQISNNIGSLQSQIEELKKQLQQSKYQFKTLFENNTAQVHLWKLVKNDNGKLLTWILSDVNKAALNSWNKNKKEVVGKTANELFGDKAVEQFMPTVEKIFNSNNSIEWTEYFEPTHQHLKMKSVSMGDYFLSIGKDITEDLEIESRLKESEKFVEEIFNNTFNFTGFLGLDGTLIDVNKTALEFGGFPKETVVGQKVYDAPWWSLGNAKKELKANIAKAAQGEFVRYEVEVLGKNNNIITIDFSLKPVLDENNKVSYIIPEGRDISEKVRIKTELEELNANLEEKVKERTQELKNTLEVVEEYKLAAELSQVGLWKWNLQTDIQTWDDTIYDLYGVEKGDFATVTEACFSGIHIDDRDRVKKEFQDCIAGINPFDSIFRVVKHNTQETIYVRAKGKVELDEKSKPKIIYGTKWDVTKEIAISNERNVFAKELEQKNKLISSASIILIADENGKIIELNEGFCKATRYESAELINEHYDIIFEDYFTPDYYLNLTNILSRGENWNGLLCIRKKDDALLWLQTTISPFINTNGEVEKYVSVSFDITEQKNLELKAKRDQENLMQQSRELMKVSRELTKQKHLLQTVFDNTDFMIFIKDLKGRFILVNKQLCKNLNLGEVNEVIGKSDFDYFDKEAAKEFQRKDQEIISRGIVQTFEEEINFPTGKKTFLTSKFPLFNESFTANGICGISVDITEKKQNEIKLKEAQAQLIQSEKMASLGLLTAGVAHEINNPLNFISGGYQAIEKHFKNNEQPNVDRIKKFVDWIKIGTHRASEVVRGLNDLSRDTLDFNEDCDITKIFRETLAILDNRLDDKGVTVVKEFNQSKNIIKGNIGKLNQLFLNLLTNATDAIEDEGKITIIVEDKKSAFFITIKDTGVGISDEDLKKVTEPFYTTKAPGEGTGLGLYICNGIVQDHKGTLEIKSKVGKGTKVLVNLPK